MKLTYNSNSKNFFVKAAFTLWFAFFTTTTFASDFYWVGGTGNWSDYGAHWATTSGGVIFHTTIPGPLDDVYFDGNSFLTAGDTMFIDNTLINNRNMNWTGVTNNPVLTATVFSATISIYGSLTLSANMKVDWNIILNFISGNTGNTIITAGNGLATLTFDNPLGSWSLSDSLNAITVTVKNGTFSTNNNNIICTAFYAGNKFPPYTTNATILLGTSNIKCENKWETSDLNLFLDAPNATFIVVGDTVIPSINPFFIGGNNHVYGDITCYTNIGGDSNIYSNLYFPYKNSHVLGDHNIYNDIYFLENGTVFANLSTFHNVYFAGPGNFGGGYNIINKALFNNDAFSGHNTYDTLLFHNPGKVIKFSDSTFINSELVIASGLSSFPTSVHSVTAGTKSFVTIPAGDTVCTDYLYVQDIEAFNGTFYAGDNSVDLGNNTGWLWSSCIPDTSNVWPGDANYDLTADNVDVLYVGLAYGYTGPTRAGASNAWVAQPSVDWLQQFANGTNLKNADCNGDGTIDNNDTTAISLNYGQTHPFKAAPPLPSNNNIGIPFYLVSNLDSAGLNFVVNLDMSLGNSSLQINNLYGLAFTLNFDTGYIDTTNISFDFSNSMMGTPGVDLMTFTKSFANQGFIDVAMARTDQNNVSGYGHLAKCGIVIVDNVAGISTVPFTITNITAFDKNEFPVTLTAYGDSLVVDTNLIASTHQIDLTQFVSVYPNPAKDKLNINGGLLNILSVELISMMGENVYNNKVDSHATSISTQNIKDGLYVLRCKTNKGIINRRVQVLK